MGLAAGVKDLLRDLFPDGFDRRPRAAASVIARDMMLLMRGRPRSVTTGLGFFYYIYELVQRELSGGVTTYVLVYDKPFVPRAKGVEQGERDEKNAPLPDDYPLQIDNGPLPDDETWQRLMSNRTLRRKAFTYLTEKLASMYAPPRGCEIFIDGGRADIVNGDGSLTDQPPIRIWTDDAGVRHVEDAALRFRNRIGEADLAIPWWIDQLGAGRVVHIESIDTDFILILVMREALRHMLPSAERAHVFLHLNPRRESNAPRPAGARESGAPPPKNGAKPKVVADWVDISEMHRLVKERYGDNGREPYYVESLALALMPGNDFIENFKGIGAKFVWQGWSLHRAQIGALVREVVVPGGGGVRDIVLDPLAVREFVRYIYEEKGGKKLVAPGDGAMTALAARMQWNLRYWRNEWRREAAAPLLPDPLACGWYTIDVEVRLGADGKELPEEAPAASVIATKLVTKVKRVAELPHQILRVHTGRVHPVRVSALATPERLAAAGAMSLAVCAAEHDLLNAGIVAALEGYVATGMTPTERFADPAACADHVWALLETGAHVALACDTPSAVLDLLRRRSKKRRSADVSDDEGGGGGVSGGGGGGGSGGAAFHVDPNIDPELALAMRMSMEEEQARQRQAAASEAVRVSGPRAAGRASKKMMV